MTVVEKICDSFKAMQLEESTKSLKAEGKTAFIRLMCEIDQKIEAERRAALKQTDTKNALEKPVRFYIYR